MALSDKAKKALEIALASSQVDASSPASEVIAAIDSNGSGPAAHVANNSHAAADTIALSTSNTYSDAAVNSAVNAALATAIADLNATRDQINSILAALQASGQMS